MTSPPKISRSTLLGSWLAGRCRFIGILAFSPGPPANRAGFHFFKPVIHLAVKFFAAPLQGVEVESHPFAACPLSDIIGMRLTCLVGGRTC
jgi:hypothetical protein